MTVQPWVRTHLWKVVAALVLSLLLLQYVFQSRQLEPLFAINTSTFARTRTHPHPRPSAPRGLLFQESGNASSTLTSPPSSSGNSSVSTIDAANFTLPLCPPIPPNLQGPIRVIKEAPSLEKLETLFPMLQQGGHYQPPFCQARDKVAIIVPYRDRAQHLSVLLVNLHPFLQHQQLEYRIIIVEQAGKGAFNRAMLMNIGFAEALKMYNFDCFIFHDVDLLPEDDRNLYTCPEQPRHMSVAIDVFKYKLPYTDIFGGVSAMTREQFQKVNGFSNMFWGWGGEDDDMSNRIKFNGYHISRYPTNIARYKMLSHRKQRANPKRYEFLNTGRKRFHTDGLNSLKYERKDLKLHKAYTQVVVELGGSS